MLDWEVQFQTTQFIFTEILSLEKEHNVSSHFDKDVQFLTLSF